MKVVNASYEILDTLNGEEILRKIERIARVCYKSTDKITEGSAEKMIRSLIKNNHDAMLEHYSFSVSFICDRGISHEIVRHRIASFAQESTRYCNYGSKDGEITVIEPFYLLVDGERVTVDNWAERYGAWREACEVAEKSYLRMIADGATPQEARAVLPTSTKTEIVMTANLREWRHFFNLRAVGTTGKPHPQMQEIAIPLLKELQEKIPVIFDDLVVEG